MKARSFGNGADFSIARKFAISGVAGSSTSPSQKDLRTVPCGRLLWSAWTERCSFFR